ncbi:MAG: hypothetical protein GF320_04170 [Armatimonadia bacterium]|nr:hypothetical protein [Armatimonadia bacterium]
MSRSQWWTTALVLASLMAGLLVAIAGCTSKGENVGAAASGDPEKKAQGKAMMEKAQRERMGGGAKKGG